MLFDSLRIGHGLSSTNYESYVRILKEKDICIETNPVSNFILGYSKDLNHHVIRRLVNYGIALTISSDDFLFWNCAPLSLDFFVAVIFADLSLREVKWIILNSIKYSLFDDMKKEVIEK